MSSPSEISAEVSASLRQMRSAIDTSVKEALREIGAQARGKHLGHATEVPGSDRKFSGTDRYNGGRLGVKVRYEYADHEVRVAPNGPWGLAEGPKGRKPDGSGSWTAGAKEVHAVADKVLPKKVDAAVDRAFRG